MKKLVIKMISIYQKKISNNLSEKGINCKFYPTCSEYMKQSITKYGLLLGGIKGFIRILRCNPFSKGGYDPVK